MGRVIHTGQALVDVTVRVPALPERGGNVMALTSERYAGGSCTILIAAARNGGQTVLAGSHGVGPNGDLIRQALAVEGVLLSADPVPDRDTGICLVMVEPSAERTFVTTLGAERQISIESLSKSTPVAGDTVCVTGYSLAVETTRDPLLQWLTDLPQGVDVVLDPGAVFAELPGAVVKDMLALTTVWTGNAQESADLCAVMGLPGSAQMEQTATRLPHCLPTGATVVVRDGENGCVLNVGGETTIVQGFPQRAVDTNGAGDTHTGVLLACRSQGMGWLEASRRANAAAAIKVTRVGPTSCPSSREVEQFLLQERGGQNGTGRSEASRQ